jgi:hypothetical protein
MKTDRVLTMDEYLDACCVVPTSVNPPARDARHVPITVADDHDSDTKAHGCRCDRWVIPAPVVSRASRKATPRLPIFGQKNKRGKKME